MPQSVQADTVSLSLPFWEDFSTSQSSPDTLKWIYGPDIFVNATLGQNPPTYNVATFDGLNSQGMAYDITNEFNGAGDSLASQFIDLTTVPQSRRGTVYFSFYWQVGGYGEMPDDKDSLVLYFRNALGDGKFSWDQKWSKIGGEDNISDRFEQAIVKVDGGNYFHNEFQFKFVSYSSQRGPFDTWHIDYIYLNENRSDNDFDELDQAMTGSPTALFGNYYSIPANVFFKQPEQYLSAQMTQVSNLENDVDPLVYSYNLTNHTTGEDYGTSISVLTDVMVAREIRAVEVYDMDEIVVNAQTDPLDSQVLVSTFYYNSDNNFLQENDNGGNPVVYPVDLTLNDTLRTRYILENYYAYDDGTAEFAAAINTPGGQVAVRFPLAEPDTLTHIDIYIPNIAPESIGQTLDITVWNHLGTTPTNSGILTRQAYTIEAPLGVNTFKRIKLAAPLLTGDTVYIGYKQTSENYLGIGFDRNNQKAKGEIYANTKGFWEQNSRLSGSLMIRPVFAYDSAFTLHEVKKELTSVFPNPSSGIIKLKGEYNSLEVFDLSGHLVFTGLKEDTFDLSFLMDGIYLLKINSKNSINTQKLIISK